MGRVSRLRKLFTVAFICIILLGVAPALVLAAEADKKDNRPERGIALYTDYSGVAVARGETVQMDLTLENKGRTDENIDVRITSVAKGWKATLKGARYQVTGMYVPEREDQDARAEPGTRKGDRSGEVSPSSSRRRPRTASSPPPIP